MQRQGKNLIPGSDLAGEVVSIGEDVKILEGERQSLRDLRHRL